MQALNIALFDWIAAGHSPHPLILAFAASVAEGSSWLCVALLAWVAWRQPSQRAYLMATLVAAAVAALASRGLANWLAVPRPFMIGLSPPHIEHGPRGSLPSAHASVMFATALVLCLRPALRKFGYAVFAIAVITGWARIYVGVHFPLDIVAGLVLGAIVAGVFRMLQALVHRYVLPMIARDDLRNARADAPLPPP